MAARVLSHVNQGMLLPMHSPGVAPVPKGNIRTSRAKQGVKIWKCATQTNTRQHPKLNMLLFTSFVFWIAVAVPTRSAMFESITNRELRAQRGTEVTSTSAIGSVYSARRVTAVTERNKRPHAEAGGTRKAWLARTCVPARSVRQERGPARQ